MSTDTVSADVADREFDAWADAWGIETDLAELSEDDAESFETQKKRITKGIRRGYVSIQGETLTLQLQHPKMDSLTEIEFNPPTGEALIGFDKFSDRQNIHKLNAFLGSMTRLAPAIFVKMDARDLKVCQAIATLFLAT